MTDRQIVSLAVVGLGYWGPNLVRNFRKFSDVKIPYLCDLDQEKVESHARNIPGCEEIGDFREIVDDNAVDAFVFATDAHTHYDFAKQAMEAGKHVFVEKPLATSSQKARELLDLSRETNRVLFVGHTFEYNPAVRQVKDYIISGEVGDVFHITSRRLNLGTIRRDVNVIWNLAPHDISIVIHWLEELPSRVLAVGYRYLQSDKEDIAFINLEFPSGKTAQITNSWLDPHKVREIVVVGSEKMIVYDDVDPNYKIKIYDKGVDMVFSKQPQDYAEFEFRLRSGDVRLPKVKMKEPMEIECREFIDAIQEGRPPLTDARNGYRVVRVLEAANESLEAGSAFIDLEWDEDVSV